jgi:hypothetical protein
MISAIANVSPAEPLAQSPGTSTQKPAQSAPPSATNTDSVQLSKAAQAALAVLQEASETPSQTAKEAGHGDLQAQRLAAREAAESVTK